MGQAPGALFAPGGHSVTFGVRDPAATQDAAAELRGKAAGASIKGRLAARAKTRAALDGSHGYQEPIDADNISVSAHDVAGKKVARRFQGASAHQGVQHTTCGRGRVQASGESVPITARCAATTSAPKATSWGSSAT
jgi:hypothetical protein